MKMTILIISEWGEKDSNLRSHKTTDLQSAPVGRFGISPTVLPPFNKAQLPLVLPHMLFKGIAKIDPFFF